MAVACRNILYVATLGLLISLVYWPIWSIRSFSPEDPIFYIINHNLTLVDVFKTYFDFYSGWYRPTSFHLWHWLLGHSVGWTEYSAYRLIHFGLFFATIVCVFALFQLVLIRILRWPRERALPIAGFAAALFAIEPIHYAALFNTTAFDYLHQLFFVAALIAWLHVALGGKSMWLAPAVVLELLALTAKEVSVCFPAIFGILLTMVPQVAKTRRVRLFILSAAPALVFFIAIAISRGAVRGSDYRTLPDIAKLFDNLAHFFDWCSFVWWHRNYNLEEFTYPAHRKLVTPLFAVATLFFVHRCRPTKQQLYLCAAILMSLIAIPIYAGGYPWHFSLGAIALCLMMSIAWEKGFFQYQKRRALYIVPIVGILSVYISIGYAQFVSVGWFSRFHKMNLAWIDSPPIACAELPQSAVIVVDNLGTDLNHWQLGNGHLFALACERADLVQKQLSDIPQSDRESVLSEPNTYCVRWDAEPGKWHMCDRSGLVDIDRGE